jgi:hypothetical protein
MTARTARLATVLSLIALVPLRAGAQSSATDTSVPPIVVEGMRAYEKGDLRAALAVWLRGSPVNNAATTEQMVASVAPIEGAYGRMIGHEILRVVPIGTAVRRVYAVLRYERGPMYGSFDCYRAETGWIIPVFNTNTRAPEVLPAGMLAGER